MRDYLVTHIETAQVEAESSEEASEKAMDGKAYWETQDVFSETVEESNEPIKLSESETEILRKGGAVEVEGQVISLDEDAEDKHGLGDVV